MPSILLLTNRVPYPLRDGGALAMDAMIRGYRDKGWEVYVLAMNTSRHPVSEDVLKTLYTDIASFQTVDVDNTISTGGILKNLFFSKAPEHADRFNSAHFEAALQETLIRYKPQVVQFESPFLANYLPLIRKVSPGTVIVYRMHNVESEIWGRLAAEGKGPKSLYLSTLARRMRIYEEQLWVDADLLLPITEADADAVRKARIETPMEVAPFGIAPEEGEHKWPPGPLKAYHIGAMDWQPNAEGLEWFLKEVWPVAHELAPEVEFHFAGRNMPEHFFQNLPEGAFCAGEVDDASAFVKDKHMLVVPLRSGSGIRVKTLEGMAAGKFVVSTTVGMQGIEAQAEGEYSRADTAQEFVHLIGWASSHMEKAASHGWAAQRLVREKYDAGEIMKRVDVRLRGMIVS